MHDNDKFRWRSCFSLILRTIWRIIERNNKGGQLMETAYRREEIISSSRASKRLGEALNEAKRMGRLVLSRNNRLEAVILPIEEYEGIVEDLEHLLIALEIQDRKGRDRGKRVSWQSLKAKYGL
jgi:prevent-host-death family protein